MYLIENSVFQSFVSENNFLKKSEGIIIIITIIIIVMIITTQLLILQCKIFGWNLLSQGNMCVVNIIKHVF